MSRFMHGLSFKLDGLFKQLIGMFLNQAADILGNDRTDLLPPESKHKWHKVKNPE